MHLILKIIASRPVAANFLKAVVSVAGEAGIGPRGGTISEDDVAEEGYEFHLVDWIEGGKFANLGK